MRSIIERRRGRSYGGMDLIAPLVKTLDPPLVRFLSNLPPSKHHNLYKEAAKKQRKEEREGEGRGEVLWRGGFICTI